MKFIVLFEDSPEADPETRKIYMAQHLGFLEANADRIEAAGPLSDTAGVGRDGLWIVETDIAEDVKRLILEDPFWPSGLRKSYAIIKWTQVFAGGARLIRPS